eukprot:GDKK01004682.1.p1 GENE.GDKK01004682.1~~GDKK01004682.1.p1  ORF type:complete len:204 (-),score=35.04 GDKK01004682.1:62-673(-)
MDELLSIFDLYDTNRQNQLPRKDIADIIRSAGIHMSNKELDAILLFEVQSAPPAPAPTKATKGAPAATPQAAPTRIDISKQLMTKEDFKRFVAEKDLASKVVTKSIANSSRFKAYNDVMAALQAFDYKENGYLTKGDVLGALTTMNEKLQQHEIEIALGGAPWMEGDGHHSSSKVKLEDLARHLTRHFTSVSIGNDEVLMAMQ